MDQFDFFNPEAMARATSERRSQLKGNVARTVAETFNTPSGRECLRYLEALLAGKAGAVQRQGESAEDSIRRDAYRDVWFWIESMAKEGAREREIV